MGADVVIVDGLPAEMRASDGQLLHVAIVEQKYIRYDAIQ